MSKKLLFITTTLAVSCMACSGVFANEISLTTSQGTKTYVEDESQEADISYVDLLVSNMPGSEHGQHIKAGILLEAAMSGEDAVVTGSQVSDYANGSCYLALQNGEKEAKEVYRWHDEDNVTHISNRVLKEDQKWGDWTSNDNDYIGYDFTHISDVTNGLTVLKNIYVGEDGNTYYIAQANLNLGGADDGYESVEPETEEPVAAENGSSAVITAVFNTSDRTFADIDISSAGLWENVNGSMFWSDSGTIVSVEDLHINISIEDTEEVPEIPEEAKAASENKETEDADSINAAIGAAQVILSELF